MRFVSDLQRAVANSEMPPTARHIILTLAINANWDTGVIPPEHGPSFETLARKTGLSKSTVTEWMPCLQTAGWVKVTAPPKGSKHDRNHYELFIGSPHVDKPVRASRRSTKTASDPTPDDEPSPPSNGPPGGPYRQADRSDVSVVSGFGMPPGGPYRQADTDSGPPGGTSAVRLAEPSGPPGGTASIGNSPSESSPSKVRPRRATSATADASPGSTARRRGTRIPIGFWPADASVVWARRDAPLIEVAVATAAFIDYWTSLTDPAGRRADWDATWRTWMRLEQAKREKAPGFTGRRVQTAVDAVPAHRPAADAMCPTHPGQLKTGCGPCQGAAKGVDTVAADAPRTTAIAMCPEHPDVPAAFCHPCRPARTATDRRHP